MGEAASGTTAAAPWRGAFLAVAERELELATAGLKVAAADYAATVNANARGRLHDASARGVALGRRSGLTQAALRFAAAERMVYHARMGVGA